MTSRTHVRRWAPPFSEALRLAWRPALAYLVFTGLGSMVLLLTAAYYNHTGSNDLVIFVLGTVAGFVGVLLGQFLSILRLRALPVFVITGLCGALVAWMFAMASPPGGEYIGIPLVFFLFAFPCGLLSLMHRYELFASFWPAVGWIGGVFIILNEENRVTVWEQDKVKAWLPIPLLYLAGFLVFWLLYLAAKQATRVELWQALSGAAARRIAKAESRQHRPSALPKKNMLALLVVAAVLFLGTAALAPYLWRTGKGDHEGHHEGTEQVQEPKPKPKPMDGGGESVAKALRELAQAAKDTLPKLWPLLLLLLLYRPAKRALLMAHLQAPLVPTPPSERIDNLWEYVRIAAEDAAVIPASADSVEQLLVRIRDAKRGGAALDAAAEIYVRTRYGFTVQRGDAVAMRGHAIEASTAIRKDLGLWATVRNLWRPLE